MTEDDAVRLLNERVSLFAREIAALSAPPRSSYAAHQSAIARIIRTSLSDEDVCVRNSAHG
ncbi:hypothetical protein ACH0BU_16625 [Sphingomonas olei]